jgi:hypothetical protein
MPSRQRGAAYVSIFFFLIMLVLFLGALGFAYVTLEKNTELEATIARVRAERNEVEGRFILYRHYVEDLSKIGETGEYAGRQNFNYSDYGNPPPLTNVTVPTRVFDAMRVFARDVKVPESQELATLFSVAKNAMDAAERQQRELESERTTLQNQIAELQSSINDLTANHKARESELNRELRQRSDDYQASLADKDNTIQSANSEYRRLREERSDDAAQHALSVAGLRREIETLQAQIDAAFNKVRLINPAAAADGMVLDASQAVGLAWINLGRRDMLPIGTTFEIVKPGTDEVKAYGVVSRVHDNRSELRVTGLKDRFDPVVPGDQVRNDLYSPEMRHNIYLMGRFAQPYTKPLVKTILEDLGNRVTDELGPGVDLVILGADTINEEGSGFTPISDTEEFKRAQFLRIEMSPLSKVRQYLKLTDEMTETAAR